VVAGAKIKLGEVLGVMQLVQQLIDDWNGKLVFDCFVVEGTLVDAESPGVVRFLHEQDRRRE
jgi:hypothetical protein